MPSVHRSLGPVDCFLVRLGFRLRGLGFKGCRGSGLREITHLLGTDYEYIIIWNPKTEGLIGSR